MTAWLTNDVRWVIDEACSIVADIDTMGYWVVGRLERVVGGGVRLGRVVWGSVRE